MLESMQYCDDLVEINFLERQILMNLFRCLTESAVFIHRVNQSERDQSVVIRKSCQIELPQQMLAKRFLL